jgi:hypothetical protein
MGTRRDWRSSAWEPRRWTSSWPPTCVWTGLSRPVRASLCLVVWPVCDPRNSGRWTPPGGARTIAVACRLASRLAPIPRQGASGSAEGPSQVMTPLAHSQRRISSSKLARTARSFRSRRKTTSVATAGDLSNMTVRYPPFPQVSTIGPWPVGDFWHVSNTRLGASKPGRYVATTN